MCDDETWMPENEGPKEKAGAKPARSEADSAYFAALTM